MNCRTPCMTALALLLSVGTVTASATSGGDAAASCIPVNEAALGKLPQAAPDKTAAAALLDGIEQHYVKRKGGKRAGTVKRALHKAGDSAGVAAGMLYMGGALQASIYAFAEVVRHKPDDANAWTNLGAALNDAKAYREAAAALRYALKLEPSNGIARSNLAIVYARLGDAETAIAMLEKSLKDVSGQLEANIALAQLYECKDHPLRAMQAAREAYRIKPTQRGRKIIKKTAKDAGKSEAWVDYQGLACIIHGASW